MADSAYDYSVIYLADGEEDSVYHCNCSANGYTDPSAENVTFSMAPIGAAKIRWVFPAGTSEYTAYVFDQDCTATRKDGLPLKRFGLPPMYGDMGDSVPMGSFEQRAYVEEERAWVEAGSAGIRAARDDGFPKPAGASPFTDVTSGDYFADTAAWAYERGIISGTTFAGNTPCTRSMAVTYMWKAAGSPSAKSAGFTDVPAGADYAQAVEHGITAGASATAFSPDSICSCGQIATFLYRVYK